MSLTPCRARRSVRGITGTFYCTHPKVHATRNFVSPGVCRACRWASCTEEFKLRPFPPARVSIRSLQDLQIVVARYGEDITWLKSFSDTSIIVYEKEDEPVNGALPNVGREAHTYLHHIITRYDDLFELTAFLQGHPFDHVPALAEAIWHLHPDIGFWDLGDISLFEASNGAPNHPGLDLGGFYESLFLRPAPEFFCAFAAACFVVSRDRIHSRPKEFYERALRLVVEHPQGAWVIERMWNEIFCGPRLTSPSRRRGVLTAADAGYFDQLQMMCDSLRAVDGPTVTVFNTGLAPNQLDRLLRMETVEVLPEPRLVSHLAPLRWDAKASTWLKPLWMFHSPYEDTLWIDADCIVLQPLDEVWELLDTGPFAVRDGHQWSRNPDGLYRELPVPSERIPQDVANAGVVGLRRTRDSELLAAWGFGVQFVADPDHRALSAYQDQGMFNWAIHRLGLDHWISDRTKWNLEPDKDFDVVRRAYANSLSIWEQLRQDHPDVGIMHFMGQRKLPYLFIEELSRSLTLPPEEEGRD